MEKIKNYLSSLGRKKYIIYFLITLLIGGGIYYMLPDTIKREISEFVSDIFFKNPSTHILKVIPEESAFVMSFTPANFLAKMDIEDLMKTELGENAEDFSKKADLGILEDLFEDPTISGIDYLSEVFVFHSYENAEEHYLCVSAGIQDDGNFGEFLEDISKEAGDKIKIKEEDDFNYFTEGGGGIVWDDDKFIFMLGTTGEDDLEDHMEKLMTLEEDDRITSNDNFNTFYEKRQDLSVWISTEMINEFEDEIEDNFGYELRDIERELGMSSKDIINMYDDNIITFHINFANGEIVCSSEFIPNSELKDLNSEYNLWDLDFNEKLLKYIPDNNIAIFIQKINVDAYYKLIKKYIDSDNIDRFEREMRNETGLDIDDIFNTFAGSFIANISGFGSIETTISDYGRYYNDSMYSDYDYYYDEYIYEGGYDWGYYEKDTTMTLPLFSVVFDMKDSYFIEEMIELGIDAGAITDGEYYSFDADGMNMFIDFNKTTFMVTNDQDAINQFNNNGYNKHLSSSNNIVDNISYAYLNLDADKYSHLIEESFGGRMPREVEMMMDIWDDLFESVEFKQSINESSGTFSAEFKMSFKDKDKNILQTIFNLFEDNSREIYNIIN
ncbi:MAG: DUF4836 family protein [Flavobacteriales bacterium]|nr:DUF4836 family protein [Flavobacteriales bacterium]MBT5354916.1 DUF4836 family protein [Flavobacteriales bacterium]MBT5698826.1 DUF4836 family protein [Flavobacteriales bacterium]MBT7620362.1 DUF4836 family protein [Flavobacteriales bacterium]